MVRVKPYEGGWIVECDSCGFTSDKYKIHKNAKRKGERHQEKHIKPQGR